LCHGRANFLPSPRYFIRNLATSRERVEERLTETVQTRLVRRVHDEWLAIDVVVCVIFARVIRDEPFDVPKADVTLLLEDRKQLFAMYRVRIELVDAGQQNVRFTHVTYKSNVLKL